MGSQPSSCSTNRQIQGLLVTKQISARRKAPIYLNKKLSRSEILSVIDFDYKDYDQQKRPQSETIRDVTITGKINGEVKHLKISKTAEPVQRGNQVKYSNSLSIKQNKDIKMEETTTEEFDHLDHWVHKNEPYVKNSDIHHDSSVDKKVTNGKQASAAKPTVTKTKVGNAQDGSKDKSEEKSDDEKDENEDAEDLSPEEVFERAKAEQIEKTKVAIEGLKKLQNDRTEEGHFSDELRKCITNLYNSYFAMKKFKISRRVQHRLELNDLFLTPEFNVSEIYRCLLLELLPKSYRGETGKPITGLYRPMRSMLSFLMNFTDNRHKGFCQCLLNDDKFMQALVNKIADLSQTESEGSIKENDAILVRIILGIFHNLAQVEDFTTALRELGVIKVVTPYLKSKSDVRKLVALGVLAGIVNEEESEIIKSDSALIGFMLKCLQKAMNDKIRRCHGWSVREITRLVRMASKSDNNKRVIYTEGAGPILVELCSKAKGDDELREAVGALWTLSFNKDNQKEMVEDRETGVIDALFNLYKTTEYKDVRKTCGKALWTMRDILKASEHYKAIGQHFMTGEEFSTASPTSARGSDTHVMISYNWGNQSIMREICQNLRNNGIKVWMDVDDMQGSTLQAMAHAVEKADVVLVCYSKKYKNSDNCRAEAEYAFQLKKKIIPLKMEGYRADGWLGFIIGAKLFYDFSGKYPFEKKMTELIKDVKLTLNTVKGAGKEVPTVNTQIQPVQVQVSTVANSNTKKGGNIDMEAVKKWTPQHVGKWLDKNSLPRNLLGRLSGIEIAFLHVLVQECPDMYYKTIGDQLGVKDILTMAKLRFALEKMDIQV